MKPEQKIWLTFLRRNSSWATSSHLTLNPVPHALYETHDEVVAS